MRNKGIILFDIDRTIFDTSEHSKASILELQKVIKNASTDDIQNAKLEFLSSLSADREFDPEKLTKFLCDKFDVKDKELILDIYYNSRYKFLYTDYIYPETFEVFNKLKNKYRLGIYSEGTKKFQNHKFSSLEILEYVDKDLIFILDHKTNSKALSKIPTGVIVIDDKESVCEYLTDNGVKTIWLNKKDDRVSSKFNTIHDLSELPGMLL
jgi:FMN phosphatase YigB (HAD superfamily)